MKLPNSIPAAAAVLLSVIFHHAFFIQGFTIQSPSNAPGGAAIGINPRPNPLLLHATPKYTMPSQEESVELGIREWPLQTKTSSWTDEAKEGQTLIRYILQGSGSVTVNGKKSKKFMTGMLMEVEGPVNLKWEKDDEEDCIILTPGYENGGLLVGALVGFVAMVGALVALS
jgi:hypothetical protein